MTVYGATGVFVWLNGVPIPPFVSANGAPMAFSTALGLTLCGLALVAVAYARRRWVMLFAGGIVGAALWGVLGPEPSALFALPLPPGETGRISDLALAGFAALAGALLLVALRPAQRVWTAALATMALAPALLSLLGEVISWLAQFEWVRRAGMANAAAFGFLVGAAALWELVWRGSAGRRRTEIVSLSLFSLAAMAGLGAGLIAWKSNQLQILAIERAERSRRVSESLNYTELLLTRMESTARGFALGRQEWLLEGYHEFAGLLDQELPRLRQRMTGEESQRARLAALHELVRAKRDYMDRIIANIRAGELSTLPEEFREVRGPELTSAIRRLINEMDAEAVSAAVGLGTEAAKAGAQTSAVILMAAILGAGCVAAGAITTRRARLARDLAEERLAANAGRLRKAQEMARMGSWEFALSDRENEWWSEEAFRLFGFAPEDRTVTKAEIFARLHPVDREGVARILDDVIARRSPAQCAYRIVRPDGEVRWLHDEIEPVLDAQGAVVRVRGVMHDITEEKRAQLELAAVARLQRAVIEGTVLSIISTRADGVIATFNRGAEQLLGYLREEMVGRQTPQVFHDAEEVAARARELSVELGRPVEAGFDAFVAYSREHGVDERRWTYVRKDGTRVSVWLSITTMRDEQGSITGYLGIAHDITERERTARLLQESGERLATIFAATDRGLVLQTRDGAIVECNEAACRILGVTREQLIGGDLLDAQGEAMREDGTPFSDDEHPARLALRTGQPQTGVVQGIRRADGATAWIRITSVPIVEPDGGVGQVVSSFTEITSQLRLEAELRDSERRLRLAADVAGIGVWYWDVEAGEESVWDDRVFAIYGLPPTPNHRVRHQIWAECLLPEDAAAQEAVMRLTVETGGTARREFRIRRADTGELRIVEAAQTVILGRSGRVARVVGVNRDVTVERHAAEVLMASEERFRTLAQHAPVGIFQTDARGACLFVNERWCEIAGLQPEQALGAGWMVALHPEDAGKVAEWWREFADSGREFKHDYRFCRPNGEVAWVSGQALWLRDRYGKCIGCIGTVNDITERRELLRRLEQARDEAIEVSRLKSEFLANVSHEIRTPMNGIIGMSNLILETALNSEQREMTNVVLSSAENLMAIINDILDFSRIEAGKLRLESREFDLHIVVEETITLLNASAQAKHLEMLFEWDPSLAREFRGDAVRIRQVLINLVGNAVKFTSQGQVKVSVRRRHDTRDRSGVRIEVADTGCGIEPADQPKLFGAFVQVDGSSTRRHGGTGLGLAISRQLVQLMGGSIGVESEVGRGSTFWFELELLKLRGGSVPPLSLPQAIGDVASRPAPPRVAGRSLHLLLVEDNHPNQLVARGVLERMGHTVALASNGADALDRLAQEAFDAVLMDCQMPVMDGYTATERIRRGAVPGLDQRLPIIALTAYALPSDRLKCISAGMDEYVAKPLRAEDLEKAFSRCGLTGGPAETASAPELEAAAIDGEHLKRLADLPGRTAGTLLDEMIAIFEAETKNTLPLVAALEASRSSSELALLAHRLSGGAANLGARSLRATGLRLESAARDGDWVAVARLRREFENEWGRLRTALRKDHK